MNSVEIRLGVEYVNLCNKDVAPDVSNYVAKFSPYSEFLFGENYSELSPAAWWKAGEKMGFNPELVKLAMTIVGTNTASSGLERLFSTLGFTYGKLRGQLGVDKAGKPALLFRQFNL